MIAVISGLPTEVLEDVKKADGWKMLAARNNVPGFDDPAFFLLHNVFTGELKYFYYVNREGYSAQNNGHWNIRFESKDGRRQKMFAFFKEYAIPYNDNLGTQSGSVDGITLTNYTNNVSKGFTLGWNCFRTELTYDAGFGSSALKIDSYCDNYTSINISGTFSGTVESATSTTPLGVRLGSSAISALASKWGDGVAEQLKTAIERNSAPSKRDPTSPFYYVSTRAVPPAVIGAVIKVGGDLISKLFTSKFSKPSITTATVQGSIKLSGSMTSTVTSPVAPLTIPNFNVSTMGHIGSWNLAEAPIVRLSPYARYTGNNVDHWSSSFQRIYEYELLGEHFGHNGIGGPFVVDYDIQYNPEYHPASTWTESFLFDIGCPTSYSTSRDLFGSTDYFGPICANNWRSGSEPERYENDLLYLGYGTPLYHPVMNHKFWVYQFYRDNPNYRGNPPEYLYLNEALLDDVYKPDRIAHSYVLKIRHYAVRRNSENQLDTLVSTRTFIPKLEWRE